jgi:hypothetical protein
MTEIRRRTILSASALGLLAPAMLTSGCASAHGTRGRPSGSLAPADVALLNRVSWGIDSAASNEFRRLGRSDYLRSQLHPAPGNALPAAAQAQIDALGLRRKPMDAWAVEMEERRRAADAIADDEAKKAAQQTYQQDMNRLARDAATQMLLNALYSPNQLQEQLTWFWFNHFNVHQYKSRTRRTASTRITRAR